MGVADDQKGSAQAQGGQSNPPTDPNQTQFGIQVSPTGTFTQEDIEREIRKAESRIGQKWRERMEQDEVKAVSDDPDALKSVRAMQAARRQEEAASMRIMEAEERERKAQQVLSKAESLFTETKAKELAREHGVDYQKLIKYSGGKVELMEELAKELPKVSNTTPQARTPSTPPRLNPDNNETAGSENLTLEGLLGRDVSRMTPKQLKEHQDRIRQHARATPW